mmetsp:Transcript_21111/g.43880  ORF Transcript_21111/g.43880 Transcript_21111/m.43880 type:complete len:346 (+) Transcript_21111:142-1179(+)
MSYRGTGVHPYAQSYRDDDMSDGYTYGGDDDDAYTAQSSVRSGRSNYSRRLHQPLHVHGNGSGSGHTPLGAKPPQHDFEAFSSDAEKLSAILKCADVERHKHHLSVSYHRFRKLLLLLPTLLSSLFIAVVAFLPNTDVIKAHMHVGDVPTSEFLLILVACLGFVVLIFTLLMNTLDYGSKIAMHKGAALDLQTLCERIRMYRVERAMDEREREESEERRMERIAEEGATDSEDDDEEEDDVTRGVGINTRLDGSNGGAAGETYPPTHQQAIVPHQAGVLAKPIPPHQFQKTLAKKTATVSIPRPTTRKTHRHPRVPKSGASPPRSRKPQGRHRILRISLDPPSDQ